MRAVICWCSPRATTAPWRACRCTLTLSWTNRANTWRWWKLTARRLLLSTRTEYPPQVEDVSYGLSADGQMQGYFPSPTPGAANLTAPVADPTRRLVISEIMYHPASENSLEEYIELSNTGPQPVNLLGWHFGSGVEYAFPNVTIGPHDQLVVAADVATFNATHPGVTNVVGGWIGQLSNRGEQLEVLDAQGRRVDQVTYADHGDWAQRARGPNDQGHQGWIWQAAHDGGGKSLELINPAMPNFGQNWGASIPDGGTPGAANSLADSDIAPMILDVIHAPAIPRSSDPVTVTARIVDELARPDSVTLYWRVDGADAFTAAAMLDRGQPGDEQAGDGIYAANIPAQPDGTVVEFYVAAGDRAGNGRTSPAPALPSGQQVTNALYQVLDSYDPEAAWQPGSPVIYHQIMTAAERSEFNRINRQSDAQMHATFIAVTGAGVDVRYNAGVRIRGSQSRSNNPPNNRINLASDKPWQGITELNLNALDPVNQIAGSVLFRLAGLPAAEAKGVVMLNNGRNLFGSRLYAHLEPLGSEFAANHFPDDNGGNLYKGRRSDESPPGGRGAGLAYYGTDPVAYSSYTKMTNGSEADWSDVIELTRRLNRTSNAEYVEKVSEVADIDQWLRFLAMNELLDNDEGGIVNGDPQGDDYVLYRGTEDTRFRMIPHDVDTLFGQTNRPIFRPTGNPALARMLNQPELRRRYYAQLVDLIENTLLTEAASSALDEALRHSTGQPQIDAIKTFLRQRSQWVLSQIPREFTVDAGLTAVGGVLRTTRPTLALTGTADVVETESILVNGVPVETYDGQGQWSLGTGQGDANRQTLIVSGGTWRYLDDGSDQGAQWRAAEFNDAGWRSGPAVLGYGDGDEATVVNYVDTNPSDPAVNKNATTYFRSTFQVADLADISALAIRMRYDDAAAVYINGVEAIRTDNLPAGAAFDTFATANAPGEGQYYDFTVSREALAALVQGRNTIAAEVHQAGPTSSDIKFDLELSAVIASEQTGGIPLNPGLNRIVVQAFDGPDGTGNVVNSQVLDVWYDGNTTSLASQTIGAGTITQDLILSAAGGPYTVSGDVVVAPTARLTILPGTSVFFAHNAELRVQGQIRAEGTADQPIRFTRVPGTTGSWDGIQLVGSMRDNLIHDAIIEYAVTDDGSIGLENSRLQLERVTLDHTDRRRIRSIDSSLVVRNSTFADIFPPGQEPTTNNMSEHIWGSGIPVGGQFVVENNFFGTTTGHNDAIDFDAPRGVGRPIQILNNVFAGGGDDAMDMTGDAYIEGNVLRNFHKDEFNTDPGQGNVISASGGQFTVVRNVFDNIDHVSLVKEGAFMTFTNNTVIGARLPALYFDLPGQTSGPGRGAIVDGSVFVDTPTLLGYVLPTTELAIHRSIVPAEHAALGQGNITLPAGQPDADGGYQLPPSSPAIGTGPNGLDMGARVPAGVSLAGEPAELTSITAATLTARGPGTTHYRYRVDGGPWSAETPIDTPIRLTNLANGTHTVWAIGRNQAGVWQAESEAASRTWTVQRSPAVRSTIVINEVLAENVSPVAGQGAGPDLVELHNMGDTPVDLRGMSLTDDPNEPAKSVFTQSQVIGPGAYLTLLADKAVTGASLHLGFALAAGGEGVYLYDTPANGGRLLDSVQFGMQIPGLSIGRLGDDGHWGLNVPTFGTANIGQATGDPGGLKINEWLAVADQLVQDDFLELYNPDPLPVDMGGLWLTDELGGAPAMQQIAPLSFVAGSGYAVFVADGKAENGSDHLNFRLSADQEILALLDAQLQPIDRVAYFPQTTDVSQGRSPNGGNSYQFFPLPTRGAANPQGASVSRERLLDFDAPWKYEDSGTDLGTAWREPQFNDANWASGPGPLGVENEVLPIPLATHLQIGSLTFYFRRVLLLDADPEDLTLELTTMVDDGIVVYVNGTEVMRLGMPTGEINHQSLASRAANEAEIEGPFTIPSSALVRGENVIAVELHQNNAPSTDIVLGMQIDAAVRREDPQDGNDAAILDGLRVTEIMYNPYDPGPLEFIELQNTSDQAVNLGGVRIREAIEFTFPAMTLESAGRVVVVQNVPAFVARYGTTARVVGQYGGTLDDFQLSNSGETLRLEDSLGRTIQGFSYNDAGTWPDRADGHGSSLEVIDTAGDYGDDQNWHSSSLFGGTPGNAAVAPVVDVVINEVLSHTDPPLTDAIELYNTTSRPVDISGWWVSDSSEDFRKYRIPAGTVLGAGRYLVLNESHFNATGGADSRDFALSSSHGDDVWLVQADSSGRLLRVADHVTFGATELGVSLGRWPNGTGPLFPPSSRTLGGANSGPRPGEVIISELHYNPVDADGVGPLFAADLEFVELYNRTTSTIDLTGWRLAGGVDITVGAGTTLGPRQTVLVVPFAPGDQQQLELFRLAYNLAPSVRLIGPYAGTLDNGGETIRLERPDTPPQEEPDFTPYLLVDRIAYDDLRALACDTRWGRRFPVAHLVARPG